MATVLVVDDAADNRDLVRTVLRHHGHSTVEAEGGEQALALLADSHLLPDLVLTDLQMPGMDGTELANAIWAEPATETVPVLFYTAGYPSELIDRLDADRTVNIVCKDGDLVALVDAVEDALRAAVPGLRSASEIVALLDQLPAVVAYWDRNVRTGSPTSRTSTGSASHRAICGGCTCETSWGTSSTRRTARTSPWSSLARRRHSTAWCAMRTGPSGTHR